jgi:tetratricopeptide (TPR) repeat protein
VEKIFLEAIHLHGEGNLKEAKEKYYQVLLLDKHNINSYNNLGAIYAQEGSYEKAFKNFNIAIELKPDHAEAWFNKGNLLYNLQDFEESIFSFTQAINFRPNYIEALLKKGDALFEVGSYKEALKESDLVISLEPTCAEAWLNKGNALDGMMMQDDALFCYDRAIELDQNFYESWSNKGKIYHALRCFDEAIQCFDKAIKINPNYFEAYFNKSFTQLLLGNFIEGWKNYEFRWQTKRFKNKFRHSNIKTLKDINDVKQKKLLIWSDEGFGDIIQAVRFVKLLSTHTDNIILEVHEDLKNLIKNSFPKCSVISIGESYSDVDYQIPFMSLPSVLNLTLDSIPQDIPYLKVEENLVAKWLDNLKIKKEKLNIGIACSGNNLYRENKTRSLDLHHFKPLLKISNLFLIQKEIKLLENEFLLSNKEITFLGDKINSFYDTAAIVQNMDLIISMDTSLVHLGGSLGKKTYVLLNWPHDHRWLLNQHKSYLYPSVTILRKEFNQDWDLLIKNLISNYV